jgi:hypothetical protein
MKRQLWKTRTLLFLIIGLGIFFRFYNLGWGDGFFFHPDEANIARSIAQLKPPRFHPHFFAYGHFSIYLVYFLSQFLNLVGGGKIFSLVPFPQAVYGLRALSALESALVVFLSFKIAQELFGKRAGLWAAALVGLTPGLIQAAHFGTTESLLTLILLTVLYFSLRLGSSKPKRRVFIILGVVLGIGLATKINGLAFFSFPLLALVLARRRKKFFLWLLGGFFLAFLISFATSPYQLLEWREFWGTASYEIKVAQGKTPVFYTRQFIETKPFVFQLTRIFPFSLNPFLEIAGLSGFFLMIVRLFGKETWKFKQKRILLLWAFLTCLVPNSLLFTKWTRFVVPTLPFFVLFSLEIFFLKGRRVKRFSPKLALGALVLAGVFSSLAFFRVYKREDVRVRASDWMAENLPSGAIIFNEAGNVVDIPLRGSFYKINFDFYSLEENPFLWRNLFLSLTRSQYLVVPSRRIFANHPLHLYPRTACYFKLLFSGKLGFSEVKKFTSYPALGVGTWQFEIPDEKAEETWSVFDHPVVRVYKKEGFYSEREYGQIFNSCLDGVY